MIIGNYIESILIIFGISAAILILWQEKYAKVSACPSLPRSRREITGFLHGHFKARLRSAEPVKICELGCGWGGLVGHLARAFPDTRIQAYEISWLPYLVSKLRFIFSKNIKISRKSFFLEDLSQFDAIVCYLSPWHMQQLKPKLQKLKSGSVLISNSFAIPDQAATKTLNVNALYCKIPIYIYCN